MAGAYRAVLWDYGNVLVRWDPRLLYRRLFKDEQEIDWFLANVCTMGWHLRHDQGVPMVENAEPLKAKFPEYAAEIDAWRLRFGEMLGGPIPGIGEIVEALAKSGIRQGILTNMPAEVVDVCFKDFSQLGCFSGVTVSGFEKAAKPSPEAFQRALAAMGATAAETLFIDDSKDNIAAAANLGFGVHLFVGREALHANLSEAGLLD